MGELRVSVIMSVYNGTAWLAQSVGSVLGQTLTELELIAVDDGSVDGSWDLLQDLASRDRRLVPLRNEQNRGFAVSQNRAIAQSRAALVACQDQDDVSLPERLARQVEYLDQHPEIGVLGVWPQFLNALGHFIEPGTFRYEADSARLPSLLLSSYCVCGPSIVARRSLLVVCGGYDPTMRAAEDLDLLLRLSERAGLANLPERLYWYRQHSDSVSHLNRHMQMHNNAAAREAALNRRFGGAPPLESVVHVAGGFLRAAFLALGLDQIEAGRRSIEGAQRLSPRPSVFAQRAGEELWRYLVHFPHHDPFGIVDRAFTELLPATRPMRRQRAKIRGRLHMAKVFEAPRDRGVPELGRHLWGGMKADPRWILNRGVWAIGLRQAVAAGKHFLA